MAHVVCATWTAREESVDEVAAALMALAGPSREEPGNLEYRAHRDPGDHRVFFLYESYVDADAYQAHLDSDHFGIARDRAIPLLQSRERAFYETWEV